MSRVRVDRFLAAMVGCVVLALLFPRLAMSLPVSLDAVTGVGISLVFFLHGASLSRASLKSGALKWRLHVLVQSSTFVLFPVLGACLYFGLAPVLPSDTRIGLFFLCALCSTISSSVAMVGIARGDVAAAVFDASLSGLLGMVFTPALMTLVASTHAGSLSVFEASRDIAVTLLLPFAAGHLSRPVLGTLVARHKRATSTLDFGVIVLIVFASFSRATAEGVWARYPLGALVLVAAIVLLLLAAALAVTTMLARLLGFSIDDEIVAVFCGSKKSLANGAPIARILFGAHASLSLILLPLLLYHQAQLLVCAWMARRYADRGALRSSPPAQFSTEERHA